MFLIDHLPVTLSNEIYPVAVMQQRMAEKVKDCISTMGETYLLHPNNHVKRLEVPRNTFQVTYAAQPEWSLDSVFKSNRRNH